MPIFGGVILDRNTDGVLTGFDFIVEIGRLTHMITIEVDTGGGGGIDLQGGLFVANKWKAATA